MLQLSSSSPYGSEVSRCGVGGGLKGGAKGRQAVAGGGTPVMMVRIRVCQVRKTW